MYTILINFFPNLLLPCEREDRLYDVNKKNRSILQTINNWF
ncbi:MAG: hypothetical protein CM15mP10_0680 [Actinomycetota bacterium]|nr:MAG: hypothetical protein CM15mP10_0680 [Actinomycetota bacterium]